MKDTRIFFVFKGMIRTKTADLKIPRQYPQFKDEEALIIVSGAQSMIMYKASKGRLEILESFEIPNPRYSDNEGFFKIRSHGEVWRSGAVREFDFDAILKEFIKEFKKRIKKYSEAFSSVYILASGKSKKEIEEAMPKNLQDKVAMVKEGNYQNYHPTKILGIIAK